jgi:hypothetical protein
MWWRGVFRVSLPALSSFIREYVVGLPEGQTNVLADYSEAISDYNLIKYSVKSMSIESGNLAET